FGSAEWGAFTPLSSDGGRHLTTIGDAGGVSGNMGIYSIALTLDPVLDPELPGTYPVLLGIRFFNDTTV
ncbi:MAG: hypothetical protein GWO24_22835, partial [Akkermansiaceae bacterium]|nr:hypothetical protein [Akkermansiaceae bacterium]